MTPWLTCTGAELLAAEPAALAARLAVTQSRRYREVGPEQIDAWTATLQTLRAVVDQPGAAAWTILLEYDLLRLERRIDAVLLTDRTILVLEFKAGATTFRPEDMRQVEDYALDLRDFHAGSRHHPILPVLVATHAPPPRNDWPLPLPGVTPVLRASAATLPTLVAETQRHFPPTTPALAGPAWIAAPYRPVPGIVDAARLMFARHGVEDIAAARADTANLTLTTDAIRAAIATACQHGQRLVLFVTGIPGAGKTLCGLNIVFSEQAEDAAFLTGNAPLVAVLREALARDARAEGRRQPARQGRGFLQNVHRFLEAHIRDATNPPPEHVVVFDEAQRAWDASQATRDTQRRQSVLSDSEPAHMLEIMSRPPGWAVIVALVGHGQEINTGEAGLAEWGRVIAASNGAWQALAAPRVIGAAEPAQCLSPTPAPWLREDPSLDLTVPIRSVRDTHGAAWVDAVLSNRPEDAARIATQAPPPFFLTRDLAAARTALRYRARGLRRAGLVCSSGARRLRADGLGHVLHGADDAVRWFLDRWPDVRASDALEVCATEYACQGLELDLVGLAWGGDFIHGRAGWQARAFAGSRWNSVKKAQEQHFIRNTYRVLLTRARYETIIWVPPGDPADVTRPAFEFDTLATHLATCGAQPLPEAWTMAEPPAAELALL
ncbi:DUF2075 domain-containing protein [Roseomonas aerophila]|uniref:DUF2075 domain-containing protein n=1 Tax=Teichococcus aerophilus TaxID=1224513 RepID=A0ABR7RTQ0_9PROT|nr:DUF2075 domain-containing protein [Pseudoroseomonas aerophila]MBC9209763.1 DUF2075 domain-containing protein [Pseudoroseomonas aerophila]